MISVPLDKNLKKSINVIDSFSPVFDLNNLTRTNSYFEAGSQEKKVILEEQPLTKS